MLRSLLVLVGGYLVLGPALAQQAGSDHGRYQIAPDGDGFVRLDTETGALSHCERSDGVWQCAVVVEDRVEIDRRIAALQEEMASLKANLEELGNRLTALEDGLDQPERSPPGDGLSAQQEQELDEALSFAERMMQRFFDMIRELKNEQSPQQI